jgi:hypothetical protein
MVDAAIYTVMAVEDTDFQQMATAWAIPYTAMDSIADSTEAGRDSMRDALSY